MSAIKVKEEVLIENVRSVKENVRDVEILSVNGFVTGLVRNS